MQDRGTMPTYRYQCAKCGEQFELWQSIHDDSLERHPGCGGKVTKVMSPAGIVLKGPGFYRTDNRAAGKRSKDKEPAKDGASGNGSGSGSKESKSSTGSDSNGSKSEPSKGSGSDGSKGSKGETSKSGSSSS
jgi:putative FmdB family regulatory protein